jgi:uncharacterized membrane protein (UPF0127 family)
MKLEALLLLVVFGVVGVVATGLIKSMPNSLPKQETGITVNLEMADTHELRVKGLKGHTPLQDDNGMLFTFDTPQVICMWNKDVDFPVSVGFFDKDWRLINVEEMAANSTEKTCSSGPAKHAIEMKKGWFGGKLGGIRK